MENLLEIILFVVFITINSFCSAYLVHIISIAITKKTYYKKQLLISTLCLLPFVIMNTILQLHFVSLKYLVPIIATIVCLLISLLIYKNAMSKSIILLILYCIFTFVIDIIFALILLCIGKSTEYINSNNTYYYIFAALANLFAIGIAHFIYRITIKKITFKNIFKANYRCIFFQAITIMICLIPSMFLMFSNNYNYPISFVIINTLQLIVVSVFSILYMKKQIHFKDTELELENAKLHNKALSTINENIRGFKHDMGNMVQAINGYLSVGNIDGVKAYCQNLLQGFNDVNLLSILSPKIINEPAIYGVVVGKMLYAREKKLNLSLDIGLDVSSINFPSFELSRIIGILLDNAIEAALETEEKKIKLEMVYDESKNADVIIIGNSVSDPDKVDVIKMFEKDYSTKENPSGFGLFEVLKFLKKNQKGDIVPNIDYDKNFFTQTLTFDK